MRRQALKFMEWQDRLFRRKGQKVLVVVPIAHREGVMRFMHDSMGHLDAGKTRRMIMERYWWPKADPDVFRYVKKCNTCQRMKKMPAYPTELTIPITSRFEVFSIEFAGPFPETGMDHRHLLVCVEHLKGWPIVVPTRDATAQVVRNFISTEIIHPFGIPKKVVSDNAQCFTAGLMTEFTAEQGIKWKTVFAYASMFNGRAERMVKTIKNSLHGDDWDLNGRRVVYGYRRRPLTTGASPFELMYGVPPRMVQDDGRREAGAQ